MAAHFEHSICIAEERAEILTELPQRVYDRIGVGVPLPAA